MYTDPYSGGEGEALAALGAYFGCIAIFTILFLVLYLWLFYRIFKKAGYSGWMTLLNLIPYIGSVIVVFMLAFGDWPALRGRDSGGSGYPPAYPPTYPPAGQQPIPPTGPAYQPPAPPMAQQPAPPVFEPAPAPEPAAPPAVPPAAPSEEPPQTPPV